MLGDPQASIKSLISSPDDPAVVFKAQTIRRSVEMQIGWAGQMARTRTEKRDIAELLDQGRAEEALVIVE